MSKLLINESPLQVLPNLAKRIGLNEAIILQQIHYWLGNSEVGKIIDGRKWIFNSVRQWQEDNFPFWSEATIKRALTDLAKLGLIETRNDLNQKGFDKTNWYTINYDALESLENKSVTQPLGQNDPTSGSNCTDGMGQNDPTNTKDYSETTTERENAPDFLDDVFQKQDQISEVTGPNPEDQWFEYRDKFLDLFQRLLGRHPAEVEKEEIIKLANEPEADPGRWEAAIRETRLNFTGHRVPLARIIEVYQAGGTWEYWKKWRYPNDDDKSNSGPKLTPEQAERARELFEQEQLERARSGTTA